MSEIERVTFYPEKGRRRIGSMVEGRPDWVLSRQRAWGVPITLFVRADGAYLQDAEVNARVIAAVREAGVDAWDESRKAEFLGSQYDPDEFEMVTDILDVWFDQRLHPRLHAGERPLARTALACRPLSRRLRPASRLVPVLFARELRHPRPRTL